MNPPSALYGAMSKERKPFTYTPGGLDLSEIKSERMAKRLMRNAMSQGVPEKPAQLIQSPPPVASGALPNFNCLPVQVFPAFQLPANPKSLLRTRSNPDRSKEPQTIDKLDVRKETNKPLSQTSNYNIGNNNIQALRNDYKTKESYMPVKTEPRYYGSYGNTEIILPEKFYDAEYIQTEPLVPSKILERKNLVSQDKPLENLLYNSNVFKPDVQLNTTYNNEVNPVAVATVPYQDIATNNYDQKEVKFVSKETKTENETKENGDTDTAVVVKLPTKTSAAKTETKVEVLKKILPDGTIEEVKTTTTKTIKDGKTEISTKTETRTIPKEIIGEVEIEEQEEESENIIEDSESNEIVEKVEIKETELENGEEIVEESDQEEVIDKKHDDVKENGNIITGEEKIETSTTKKVVVIQSTEQESEEEVEEEVEDEEENRDVDVEEVIILKKPENKENEENEVAEVEEKEEEEVTQDNDGELEEVVEDEKQVQELEESETENVKEVEDGEEEVVDDEIPIATEEQDEQEDQDEQEEQDEQEDQDEQEEQDEQDKQHEQDENQIKLEEVAVEVDIPKEQEEKEEEEEFEEAEDTEVELQEKPTNTQADEVTVVKIKINEQKDDTEALIKESTTEPKANRENNEEKQVGNEIIHKTSIPEPRVTFREPSIPFEKVEEIEIKPIGPAQEIIKKSHTEIITTTTDKPSGALSTQTEYNRIENIVTVNRTSKTLDQAYEQTQHQIPTLKTYFSPTNDRVLSTPQPMSRPYQPIYTSEPQTERRHSLLLDRLSVDRQIPASDMYQNNYNVNQSYEQNQWTEEPQSEVLTVSNVKPSTISKNQQWYQQTKRENILSNTVSPTPVPSSQLWNQQSQTQNQLSTQAPYQTFSQQQYTPKPEYQATYLESNAQNIYKSNTNTLDQNVYPSYTPKPSWVSSTFDSKPAPPSSSNLYSSLGKESTEIFQKSSQQFNSSYVPPPWEQDSSYVNNNQNYYQAPPPSTVYTPVTNQQTPWKPTPASNKFSKPTPTSYIPPAPNQSFVKPVSSADTSKMSGRKTYYSEYERRYISVPESTYIPNETKFPAQPDPSPQYYYDNNEPTESVEPQWRKELREFTEKTTSTTSQTEMSSIRPPWEEDPKYVSSSEYTAPVTPSWTQTLRPRSWRERSYEPEYIGSKEWPKTNTLGRGRPQSSYIKSNVDTIPERTRGVSVDRYNPNSYHSPIPSEHPPVQSHTLDPTIHPRTYHNPHVPAYHARASAEPREQTTAYPQQRIRADTRTPPVQSRSFKYLQWITGTED